MEINIAVNESASGAIPIGRQGERDARQVVFDLSWLITNFGDGTAALMHQRSKDDLPYQATTTQDGETLTWTVSDIDTAYTGYGKAEIRWTVEDALAKTIIYKTRVMESITGDTVIPDPYQSWYDQMVETVGEEAEQRAEAVARDAAVDAVSGYVEQAAASAEAAAEAAQGVAQYAETASQAAESAAQSAEAAETALEEFTSVTAEAETLAPGSDATASYADGVLTFGIPRGDKGEQGQKGDTGENGEKGDKGDTGADGFSPSVTVTEITGGHEVAITDAEGTQTFDVMDGVSPVLDDEVTEDSANGVKSSGIYDAIVNLLPTDTASGSIASFPDGADNLPVKSLTVDIEPVQSGSGDPSPDNVRPISGHTQAVVTRTGKNLWGGEKLADDIVAMVPGAVKDTNAKTISYLAPNVSDKVLLRGIFKENTQYTFIMSQATGSNSINMMFYYTDGTTGYFDQRTTTSVIGKTVSHIVGVWASGQSILNYDECGVFEGVLTVDDFEPYHGETIPVSWESEAGTVYGGTLDVVSGELVVDRAIHTFDGTDTVGLANWRPLDNSSGWLYQPSVTQGMTDVQTSSTTMSDVISDTLATQTYDNLYISDVGISIVGGTSWGIGMRVADTSLRTESAINAWLAENPITVCYKLTEPFTVQLTANEISTLLGQNNIWSDAGNVEVDYRADTKLYIQKLTGSTETDMVADTNIPNNTYFMVGNQLYLSTAAIASGATIAPGTNCTMTNLATALNALNQ